MAGKSLKGTRSHTNLKDAFAGESQANRRYLYFARVADIEGFPDMAGLFKDTADAETGHAVMELLRAVVHSEHVTALVATHDATLLDLADRVLELSDGEIVGH